MSKRSQNHRFCSSCPRWHRIDGKPCEGCWKWRCLECGTWNSVESFRCRSCGNKVEFSEPTLKAMGHPKDMTVCPRCGKKLRNGPRDKKRSFGLKD